MVEKKSWSVPPLTENFAKIIDFSFDPFPKVCVPNSRPLVQFYLIDFGLVLVVLVLVLLLVTGGKQCQLLVLSLSLKFDKKLHPRAPVVRLVIFYLVWLIFLSSVEVKCC